MTPESFAAWWEPFRVDVLKEPKEGVVETVYLDVKGQVKLTGKQQFLKGKAPAIEEPEEEGGVDEELFDDDDDSLYDLDFDDEDEEDAMACDSRWGGSTPTTVARFTMRPSRSTTPSPSGGPRNRFSAAQPGVDASTAPVLGEPGRGARGRRGRHRGDGQRRAGERPEPSGPGHGRERRGGAGEEERDRIGGAVGGKRGEHASTGPEAGRGTGEAERTPFARQRRRDACRGRGDGEERFHLHSCHERRGDQRKAQAWSSSVSRAVDARQHSQREGRRRDAVEQSRGERRAADDAGDVARQREGMDRQTAPKGNQSPAHRRSEAPVATSWRPRAYTSGPALKARAETPQRTVAKHQSATGQNCGAMRASSVIHANSTPEKPRCQAPTAPPPCRVRPRRRVRRTRRVPKCSITAPRSRAVVPRRPLTSTP